MPGEGEDAAGGKQAGGLAGAGQGQVDVGSISVTGAAAPGVAAAPVPAVAEHNEHHEFVWNIEDHFEVDWADHSASMASPSTSSDSGVISPPAAGTSSTGDLARTLYSIRLAQLVNTSSRTLQVVACMLPTDEDNITALTAVMRTVDGAPPKSHLHRVRLMASCRDPTTAASLEAVGALPLHEFSLFAAAAASLAAEGPGKPTVLLPPHSGVKELGNMVLKDIVGGPSLWGLLGAAGTRTPAADAFERAAAEAARAKLSAAAAAGSGAGDDSAGGNGVTRLLSRVTRAGAELIGEVGGAGVNLQEEEFQESGYSNTIGDLTDPTAGLGELESRLGSATSTFKKRGAMEMFGSLSMQRDEHQ
jgi:hypothetical protein